MTDNTTIAAPATAPGEGGIAIIRVSGGLSEQIGKALFFPRGKCEWESRRMYYGFIRYNGETLDECMAVLMRAPGSYTREDVLEFHLHGGVQASRRVMEAIIAQGAVPAAPGEFTKRAFLNGRIDLSRAEAVMALISASGESAAKAAVRQLEGGTASFIRSIQQEVLDLLSSLEAAIDYPDEIDSDLTLEEAADTAEKIADKLESACNERNAKILETGLDCVLCGAPNAGKSSLLNCLLGEERAIVTDIPGTTRDIVRESISLDGVRVNLSDTAGIRETGEGIEMIGINNAKRAVKNADLVLHLIDSSRPPVPEDTKTAVLAEGIPHITVYTKADLPCAVKKKEENSVSISVKTGQGIRELEDKIRVFTASANETELTQLRHIRLAKEAAGYLRDAAATSRKTNACDLCSVDLNSALYSLAMITGDRADEKLIDTIFSRFCVGK